MPWAGVCKKCDFVCIACRLRGIKEMFRGHYVKEHRGVALNLPYNMDDMNKEVLIDVSPNLTGALWKSRQYDDNNIWVGVITRDAFSYLSRLMDKNDTSKEALDYIKSEYW